MSNRGFAAVAGGLLVLAATACSSMSVNSDYDQGYDFSSLHNYAWAEISGQQQAADQLTLRRVMEATDRTLAEKGFAKTGPSEASFLVAIQTGEQDQTQYNAYGTAGWRLGAGMGTITEQTYQEGTLILDILDANKQELVWRGSAGGIIDPGASADDRTKNVNEAVTKILADFPPSSGS